METVTTIGLDIAKSVFQVHGIDARGEVIIRRRLSRARLLAFFEKLPHCLVGIEAIADHDDQRIPGDARTCLEMLTAQLAVMKKQIFENDRRIRENARETKVGRRLMEIPGVGPLLTSAFVASIADPTIFKCGRDLAAWIGLVPKQNSSGDKERLGGHLACRQPLSATNVGGRCAHPPHEPARAMGDRGCALSADHRSGSGSQGPGRFSWMYLGSACSKRRSC